MDKIRILYAEDDISVISFVKVLFKKYDFVDVVFVRNGIEALSLYEKNKFRLVITDIFMPSMNGFELIKTIQEIDSKQIFMLITGLESREDLIRAIELRVHYFIEKPIKPEKFHKVFAECLSAVNQKKESELSNRLLSQYKQAIDTSTILSKTDKKGIITYGNKAFYKISQYSEAECVGKTHKIVRHEEMDSAVFKDMWQTVQSKKQWRGIIKNRAKDGSVYIVDSLIIPLLDTNNEIIEYIGIRHDITKLEQYKEDLQNQLDIAVKDIVDTQKEVVFTMGAIGETRSKETGFHVKRVAEYSYILAKLASVEEKEAELLKLASPMHDIGKVGIPDAILNKPGKHTFEEFEIMKTHARLGYDMLKGSTREIMKTSAIVSYEHHEKWDGSGYPNAKQGEEIHIYGRITAICDVFDALGSDRVYKKAWELDKILDLFKEQRGKHFDPQLIDLFLNNIDKFLAVRDKYVD
jgi:PAS domain S-box-containing protein